MKAKHAKNLGVRCAGVLKHTVGNDGTREPGYRNCFCAGINGPDWEACQILVGFGLMREGVLINADSAQYFYATLIGAEIGCKI